MPDLQPVSRWRKLRCTVSTHHGQLPLKYARCAYGRHASTLVRYGWRRNARPAWQQPMACGLLVKEANADAPRLLRGQNEGGVDEQESREIVDGVRCAWRLRLLVRPRAEKVTFMTNWLAQAEHGGYYQAVADGTYAACGLDVTIQQGGPQVAAGRCCWPARSTSTWAATCSRRLTPLRRTSRCASSPRPSRRSRR